MVVYILSHLLQQAPLVGAELLEPSIVAETSAHPSWLEYIIYIYCRALEARNRITTQLEGSSQWLMAVRFR